MALLQGKTCDTQKDKRIMKIAFLIQDCTTVGGTERVTCCLASEMARQGHEVSVVSVFGRGGKPHFEIDGRVRFVVACGEKYGLQMSKVERMMLIVRMTREMRDNEILKDADVVIAQKFLAALIAVKAGYRHKLIIGDHYPYRLYSQPLLRYRDLIYKKAKAVVVLTEGCRQEFVNHGVNRVEVIGNMVPIAERDRGEEREKKIVAVGRLSEEKGFDSLIQAVAGVKSRIEGWSVEICGEGEQRGRLEEMIKESGLEGKVVLRGRVDDVAEEYRRASFGVVPSRYEGFSLVLLEAAAMGLPMVAFDCPYGPREILGEGGGTLVDNQDVKALGEAIVRMTEDDGLRQKYAAETRKIVERFSPKTIYDRWIQTIEKYL